MFSFDRIFARSHSTENEYSSLSDSELMSFFSSEKWPSDVNERGRILSEVSNRYCASRGLDEKAKVKLFSSDEYDGLYRNGKILLDRDSLDNPFHALDVIIHESNHFCQDRGVGYNDYEKMLLKAEGNSGYGNYKREGDYYFIQDIEIDSNNAAFEYVSSHHEEFKNDPMYREYIEERYKYFEKYSKEIELNKQYWRDKEKEHVDRALRNRDIDNVDEIVSKTIIDGEDRFKNTFLENADKCEDLRNELKEEQKISDELNDVHTTINDSANIEVVNLDPADKHEAEDDHSVGINLHEQEKADNVMETTENKDLNAENNIRPSMQKFHDYKSEDKEGQTKDNIEDQSLGYDVNLSQKEDSIKENNKDLNAETNVNQVPNSKFHPIQTKEETNDDDDDTNDGTAPEKKLVLRQHDNQENKEVEEQSKNEDKTTLLEEKTTTQQENEKEEDIEVLLFDNDPDEIKEQYSDIEILTNEVETEAKKENDDIEILSLNDENEEETVNTNEDVNTLLSEEDNNIPYENTQPDYNEINDLSDDNVNETVNDLEYDDSEEMGMSL